MKRAILILVLFALLLSACGGGILPSRDLYTPSSRLVGHWKSYTVDGAEKFFSVVDPDTGQGTYTEYNPKDGTVSVMTYKIYNETSDGEKLTILAIAPDGTELPQMEFVLIKDGKQAQMLGYYFEYVDGKTKLDPSDEKPTPTSTQPSSVTVYKIIHDTGLYKDNTVESEQLAVLRIGHRLTPANGQSTPHCENLDAGGGMMIHSCYMKSLVTGESGWVISKWMSKID